jgi:uncharacterized membrane protein
MMANILWFEYISYPILTFAFYAFAGWILESLYRSLTQQQVVNPGFLKGPFLPIYGTFTLLVAIADPWLANLAWEGQFMIFVVLSTALEYFSSLFLEWFFHLQLWDYYEIPLNFQGRIALPYSLLWGVLGLIFASFIHPQFEYYLLQVPLILRIILAIIFMTYFIWDVIQSIILHRIQCTVR